MTEHVIKVAERSLPCDLIKSPEYQQISSSAQRAFVAHVRYVQEIPYKLDEWLSAGAPISELPSLVERIGLDLMINLGVPETEGAVSPWLLSVNWVTHTRALTSFLKKEYVNGLNGTVPPIGAGLEKIERWFVSMRILLTDMLDGFFDSVTYDHAVAHLVAIHACLDGLKFGVSRIQLQYPM